jgi:hypothetical protein
MHRTLILVYSALSSVSALPSFEAETNGAAVARPVDFVTHPDAGSAGRWWSESAELAQRDSLEAWLRNQLEQDAATQETLSKRALIPGYNLFPEFLEKIKKLLNNYGDEHKSALAIWERCMFPRVSIHLRFYVVLHKHTLVDLTLFEQLVSLHELFNVHLTIDFSPPMDFKVFLDRWQQKNLGTNFQTLADDAIDDCARETNRQTMESNMGKAPIEGPDAASQFSGECV